MEFKIKMEDTDVVMEECTRDTDPMMWKDVADIKTKVNALEEETKSTLKYINGLVSSFQTDMSTVLGKMPQIEVMHEADGEFVSCKEKLHQVHKHKDTLCNTSIFNVTDLHKEKIKDPPEECSKNSEREISFPHLSSDNPFAKLEKVLLMCISIHPLMIHMDSKDSCPTLKVYANNCGFSLAFEATPTEETEGISGTWVVTANLAHKDTNIIIAKEIGEDVFSLKESLCRTVILYLSQISNVVIKKKFTDLLCMPLRLHTATLTEDDDDCDLQRQEKINPTSKAYNMGAAIYFVNMDIIKEELIYILNNYILSEDWDDLILMPEVGSSTRSNVHKFLEVFYGPWLEPINFTHNGLAYLIIRKRITLQKLIPILVSNGCDIGPYKLLRHDEPLTEDFWNDQEEISVDNRQQEMVQKKIRFPCKFPPIVPPHLIKSLHPSLMDVAFLQNCTMIIEDRPHRDHRAILMNFGHEYNLRFDYSVLERSTQAYGQFRPGPPAQWLASVTLRWLNKSFSLGAGSGYSEIEAVDDASKSALVMLSRTCNIVIRKTCREMDTQHQVEFVVQDTRDESVRRRPNQRDVWQQEMTHGRSFTILCAILDKFDDVSDLDDLIFASSTTQISRKFIYGTVVGKRYKNRMKVINFEKNGNIYLSVMKAVHPLDLTDILKNAGGEKWPYKLYPPRSLDISFLWKRPVGYIGDGTVITSMEVQDEVPEKLLLQGPPNRSPMVSAKRDRKNHHKTFADLMSHMAGKKPVECKRRWKWNKAAEIRKQKRSAKKGKVSKRQLKKLQQKN